MSTSTTALPTWNLGRHFGWESWKDNNVRVALQTLQSQAEKFSTSFKGNLHKDLERGVKEYEALYALIAKLSNFIRLHCDTDQANGDLLKFKTSVEAQLARIQADYLTFYELEVAALPEDVVTAQVTPSLEFYMPHIRKLRRRRPHQLAENVERALSIREPWVSASPVVEFFEKQLSLARFELQGETHGLETLLKNLQSPDPTLRRAALKGVNDGLRDNLIHRFAALSLNVVAGSWHIESSERQFKTLRSQRNFDNEVPDCVVDSLLTAVRTKGVALARRYYLMKKALLQKKQGLKEFTWADRIAPLPIDCRSKRYSWEEAVQICAEGYKRFSPKMLELFNKQMNEERIHAVTGIGKKTGAYCDGVIPGVGPFQLHNFLGTPRCVATLAHESGHGAHFLLSYEQGPLQYHPSLTLSETASIFGEMIVFRDLLAKTESDEERLAMLMEKIDSVVNTTVRQCSFDRFEQLVHEARQQGVVADEEFDSLWRQAIEEYYGNEGDVFDSYENTDKLWAYVHHFHVVPFYVYSYAFADLMVGALYSTYMKGHDNFETKFLDLLRAGSTKSFVELMAPFDLKPDSPEFWNESLTAHLDTLIHEAEAIVARI